ncbi:integral membrane protein [Anaeramoeba flamelloides]|uniref:Integral membrane protein n=1 Tax=Anaeramoeba flamelloides TaxID=1746091 RepID=A0AAV7Z5E0_9EUKA|nr:integral membrane protein [Anaeramoeba flamelloides]
MVINSKLEKNILVSAIESGSGWIYLIFVFHLLLAIFLLYQIIRTRHRTRKEHLGYSLIFLFSSLIVALIQTLWQGFFALYTPKFNSLVVALIVGSFIPTFLQFSSFLIYVFFLITLLFQTKSGQHSKGIFYSKIFFIVLELLLLVFGLVSCVVGGRDENKVKFVNFDDGNLSFTALVFTLTGVLLFVYLLAILKSLSQHFVPKMNFYQIQTLLVLVIVNIILFLVQGIWSICSLAHKNKLNDIFDRLFEQKDKSSYYAVCFFWNLIFQLYPTFLLAILTHLNILYSLKTKRKLMLNFYQNSNIETQDRVMISDGLKSSMSFLFCCNCCCGCTFNYPKWKENHEGKTSNPIPNNEKKKRLLDISDGKSASPSNSDEDTDSFIDHDQLLID